MRKILFAITIMLAIVSLIFMLNKNQVTEETITYFPIDPSVSFKTANTTLTLMDEKERDEYSVIWKIGSALDRDAYLRQDIGLLFVNGRLTAKMGKWKQNTKRLLQEEIFRGSESRYIEAITFHYAEIHHKNEQIFSSQRMSSDYLYVIDSAFSPLQSFRSAANKEQREWMDMLGRFTKQQLDSSWSRAIQQFSINRSQFYPIPLSTLIEYNSQPFPGFTGQETAQTIGRLWEGLYKNYFLGIRKKDGSTMDPNGSILPLILLAKDKSQLFVLTETSDGEPIMLRQQIPLNR